jgi:SAM-dependent methyltransferase
MTNGSVRSVEFNLAQAASNLAPGPEGIWVSRGQAAVSYPNGGNQNCLSLEADSFWFVHRNRCILALLDRFPPPGIVFDVGGGNGYVAYAMQQAGYPAALVEPGWQGVWNARFRGVETLICSTLEGAGFAPGSLPAVGLFDVLEHIEQEARFLDTLHTLLVPEGRLYLTVPAYPALWSADDDYAGHYRRYHLGRLRARLNAAGFRILSAGYFFMLLPLPIFLVRAIPSRLGLRRQEAWDRYQAEHKSRSGALGRILARVLDLELAYMRSGRALPFGASCLVAAEKAG